MINPLKNILFASTPIFHLESLVKCSKQGLILPFYHVVSDHNLPHLKHLYPITKTVRFNEDIDFLKKNYKPIDANYLIQNINNINFRKEKSFFLSFDDGLRQFHDEVAPILLHRGVPATFFVNTAFIDNKDMFYRLKVSILIEKIKSKNLSPAEINQINKVFSKASLIYKDAHSLHLINDSSSCLLEEIAAILEVSFSDFLERHQPYLTTNQINSLISQGFQLGSHSVSHPYYPNLTTEEQVEQTLNSVRFLVENFAIKNKLFSFPYTDYHVKKAFFDAIEPELDLTFGTANIKLDEVATNLQRIPMEVSNRKDAATIVKSEYILYILKRLINKHIIKR